MPNLQNKLLTNYYPKQGQCTTQTDQSDDSSQHMSASTQQEVSMHYQKNALRNNQTYVLIVVSYLFPTILSLTDKTP